MKYKHDIIPLSCRLMSYTEQYLDYDPFVAVPEPSNPWIGDDVTFWELEARYENLNITSLFSDFSFQSVNERERVQEV